MNPSSLNPYPLTSASAVFPFYVMFYRVARARCGGRFRRLFGLGEAPMEPAVAMRAAYAV